MDNKIWSMLSLACKAGKLSAGESVCEMALRNGSAELVIVSEDASDNTKTKFENKCFFYDIPFYIFGDSEKLSKCIGKSNRKTIAVCEGNFAESIEKLLQTEGCKKVIE